MISQIDATNGFDPHVEPVPMPMLKLEDEIQPVPMPDIEGDADRMIVDAGTGMSERMAFVIYPHDCDSLHCYGFPYLRPLGVGGDAFAGDEFTEVDLYIDSRANI